MNSNDLPDRELTPTELRQLIAANAQGLAEVRVALTETRAIADSNARAIQANSELGTENRNSITELRQAIAETQAIADSNARAIQANSESIAEGFQAVQEDLQRLAQVMEQYFAFQGRTNNSMQDGLEDHERRINRLEQPEGN